MHFFDLINVKKVALLKIPVTKPSRDRGLFYCKPINAPSCDVKL